MKKYRNFLAAPVILVVGVLISQVLSSQKQPMRRHPGNGGAKPPRTFVVKNMNIDVPIFLTGPLSAYNKAEIFAEVTGVLMDTPKRLKAGFTYKKGELLAHIDDRVYRNNVLSQKSGLLNQMTQLIPDLSIDYPASVAAWKAYLAAFDLNRPMAPLPEAASETERYYIASRNLYTQYYAVKSMEETLAKYRLKAPFEGMVSQATLNPGTLIRAGSQVASFIGSGRYEMEAFAAPHLLNRLKVGQSAVLHSEDMDGAFHARITRINTVLDASQTVRVYLETTSPGLRDGLYLSAEIETAPIEAVVRLPKSLLEKGDRVYVVDRGVLTLKSVQIMGEDGDTVVARGLNDGQIVLAEKLAGAHEGMVLPQPAQARPKAEKQGAGR